MSNASPKYQTQTDAFLDACLPGESPAMRDLRDTILRLNVQANEAKAVLLLGEVGVGKTYIARVAAMHRCWLTETFLKSESRRPTAKVISESKQFYITTRGASILDDSGNPFREVNIPTLEGPLAASQLFGHKKSAFTGADKNHIGFLGLENVTDILLDEIGYASLEMQRSLLQVLQSGEFFPLKSTSSEQAKARIFAATNQKLERLVEQGKFQEDLWWRLTDHVLYIPPLRERKESIELLAREFATRLNLAFLKGDASSHLHLSRADLEWAIAYSWPGNVRELEKTIGRWFFYRALKPLQDVHWEVLKFVPKLAANTATIPVVSLSEVALRNHVESVLTRAMNDGISIESPQKLLADILDPLESHCAEIVAACIDEHGWVKEADLKKLFKDVAPSTARSWLSKARKGIA